MLVISVFAVLAIGSKAEAATQRTGRAPDPAALNTSVDAARLFPYLGRFLNVPASDRASFTLAYYLRQNGVLATNVDGRLYDRLGQVAIRAGADGRLTPLPSRDQLSRRPRITFALPERTRLTTEMELEPTARAATEMDAVQLAGSVRQAGAVLRRFTGVLSFMVPRIRRVIFTGPVSGIAVARDGHEVRLASVRDGLVFDPSLLPTAATLRFASTPTKVVLSD